MQMPSTERSYVKSDGVKKKLFERIEEEYDLHTDWMNKQWHKCMRVLLGHDNISVTNDNDIPRTSMAIVCREAYDISWPDVKHYDTAPAKTKVVRSEAISLINNNCN
jgi:hypothetical protein